MSKRILILCRREERTTYDQKDTIQSALGGIDSPNEYVVDEYEALTFTYDGASLRVLLADGTTDIADFDTVFLWRGSRLQFLRMLH